MIFPAKRGGPKRERRPSRAAGKNDGDRAGRRPAGRLRPRQRALGWGGSEKR